MSLERFNSRTISPETSNSLTLVEHDGFPASTSDDDDLGVGVDGFAELGEVSLEESEEEEDRKVSSLIPLLLAVHERANEPCRNHRRSVCKRN